MSRWATALLALFVAFAVAAVSSAAPHDGGTLRVAEPGQYIETIDAALAGFSGDQPWLSATCGSLMRRQDASTSAGFRVVPDLATAFPKISADGKTYVFAIRKTARFSTGAPVTAADVAFTIDRILSPSLKSFNSDVFVPIEGAQRVLDGKAATASGMTASGRTLTIRLTHPVGDFSRDAAADLCVLPADPPIDPAAGLQVPIPSAGPYFISEYAPAQRLVLERNRFYAGPRPQHVESLVFDLTVDEQGALDAVVDGSADYAWVPNKYYAARAPEFIQRFGENRSRFFVQPSAFLRMFALNTTRPLLRDNVPLRQAINEAVERTALRDAFAGRYGGTPTDHFLPPIMPGYRNVHVYPLVEPDVAKARKLAAGHLRSGKLVLYVPRVNNAPDAQAQIIKRDLAHIGLKVEVDAFPLGLYFQKIQSRSEPFDMAWIGWSFGGPDPGGVLNSLFDGSTIGMSANHNLSYFDSPRWNRELRAASRLTGSARLRAFGELDVRLARDAAPAVPYSVDNALTLVSDRVGCVVVNPELDLAAVCLK